MTLCLARSETGSLLIRDEARVWIEAVSFSIDTPLSRDGISAADWKGNEETVAQSLAQADEEIAVAQVTVDGNVALVRLDLRRDLSGLSCADSFEQSRLAIPSLRLPPDLSYFLVTYGLGAADDPLGGYWPTAGVATVGRGFPERAFAPLVLFDGAGALAIAPGSQFLTSALLAADGGVARGLHGSIDQLAAGTCIETIITRGNDIADALLRLGDVLLARGGKRRPAPEASILTSTLGWWNAYGGFFTEPIRPLDEDHLTEVGDGLRRLRVPIRYIGLDLWYPYRRIGQAIRFSPDPKKYPNGLRPIAQRLGLPTVLHLSARSPDNAYGNDGANPEVYAEIAAELRRQDAIAAWHDWLRTQQHLSPGLRREPLAADRWFTEMGRLLEQSGLDLLLCMQTMGMALASTRVPNARCARSAIDYLFGQPEALDTLDRLGHTGFRAEALPASELWRQNLLVGFALHALGLLPFHDLFLTAHHPGLGGTAARTDALLRALSCGPVGIGDGPGRTDAALVRSLLDGTGHVLRPDHPPIPDTSTLGKPVEIYRTVHVAGEARWDYLLLLNTTGRPQRGAVTEGGPERFMWDVLRHRTIGQEWISLAPGELACVLIPPCHEGITLFGLTDKLVPAPRGILRSADRTIDGWRVELLAPDERFAIWSASQVAVKDDDGTCLSTTRDGNLITLELGADTGALEITRR